MVRVRHRHLVTARAALLARPRTPGALVVLVASMCALVAPSHAMADTWTWDAATGELVGELDSVSTDANPLARRHVPRFPQFLRLITCTPECPTDGAQVKRLVLRTARHIELDGEIDASSWGGDRPQLVLELGYADDRELFTRLVLPWKSGTSARIIAKGGWLYLGGGSSADVEVRSPAWQFDGEGTSAADVVDFTAADSRASLAFNSGAGHDTIRAGKGGGSLAGGTGNDVLIGSPTSQNSLHGDAGNDRLVGGSQRDQFYGGEGADIMISRAGDDTLIGGGGSDIANAGRGQDRIEMGAGNDRAIGGPGDDFFFDFLGINAVIAGAGNDHVMNGLIVGEFAHFAKRSFINCGPGRDKISDAYPRRVGCERLLRRG